MLKLEITEEKDFRRGELLGKYMAKMYIGEMIANLRMST